MGLVVLFILGWYRGLCLLLFLSLVCGEVFISVGIFWSLFFISFEIFLLGYFGYLVLF